MTPCECQASCTDKFDGVECMWPAARFLDTSNMPRCEGLNAEASEDSIA